MPLNPSVEHLEVEADGPADLDRGQPIFDAPASTGQRGPGHPQIVGRLLDREEPSLRFQNLLPLNIPQWATSPWLLLREWLFFTGRIDLPLGFFPFLPMFLEHLLNQQFSE